MERVAGKHLLKLKQELGISKNKPKKKKNGSGDETEEDEADFIPFEQKVVFAEDVRKLENEGLTKFVRLIKEHWPSAIDDVDSEKLQVKIDAIDRETFDRAKNLVNECLGQQEDDAAGD